MQDFYHQVAKEPLVELPDAVDGPRLPESPHETCHVQSQKRSAHSIGRSPSHFGPSKVMWVQGTVQFLLGIEDPKSFLLRSSLLDLYRDPSALIFAFGRLLVLFVGLPAESKLTRLFALIDTLFQTARQLASLISFYPEVPFWISKLRTSLC